VSDVRGAVEEHVAAFNAWDSARVLAGFADDATWVTGQDRFVGKAALAELFDDGLWAASPRLEVKSLLVDGSAAAIEVVETLVKDGETLVYGVAAFLEVGEDGLIRRGTVYREGNADF
jgi:ketosteroid isomerase-like protein